MKRLPIIFVGLGAAAIALAWQGATKLVIDGKPVKGTPIVVKGETYVPVAGLRDAGFTVSESQGTLTIASPADGGSQQLKGVEGKIGDWLFNGIWRFRVNGVRPNDDGRNGWLIDVDLRNGTKGDNLALDGTGFQSVQLVMDDGNVLTAPYNITDFDKPLGQSETDTVSLRYYDDDGGSRKPAKIIVRITPDAPTVGFLKSMKMSYTVPDPSFRVDLKPKA